jgi:hypothetical protein
LSQPSALGPPACVELPPRARSRFRCRRIAIICSLSHDDAWQDTPATGGTVKYIPPFDLLRRSVEISTVRGELRVSLSYDDFIKLIRLMIAGVQVDEEWYRQQYEDIGRAIRDGQIVSAKQHFVDDGYFEGRLPFGMQVDETWYQTKYPDVAESVRTGVVASPQTHFAEDGYREGRLPFDIT